MGFDQKGNVVFHVSQRKDGMWQVTEEGFEKPLAFFVKPEDAKKYVNDIASTKAGSSILIDN